MVVITVRKFHMAKVLNVFPLCHHAWTSNWYVAVRSVVRNYITRDRRGKSARIAERTTGRVKKEPGQK